MTAPTIVLQQARRILSQYGWERSRPIERTGVEVWRWQDFSLGIRPAGDDGLDFAIARKKQPLREERGADLRMLIGALPS